MGWPRALLLGEDSPGTELVQGFQSEHSALKTFNQQRIRSKGHLIALFYGFDMIGTVIADFNLGEDQLAFSSDGGTSWSTSPIADGELTTNSNNNDTGETWIFSGTELAGITPGLVLFKIMDDPGLGSITDADFVTL